MNNYSLLHVVSSNLQHNHFPSPRPTPSLSLPTPVSRRRIPFKFLPLLVPLFHLLYFPGRKTYPPPMLQVGKSSIQCLSQMVTLTSFDVAGASAKSFWPTSPACHLFPSPPPFQPTDEGTVSAVLDTIYDEKRRNDNNGKPRTWMPRRQCWGFCP